MSASTKTRRGEKGNNPRAVRWSLGVLSMTLLTVGAVVSFLVEQISPGLLIFISAFIPLAVLNYLETGDKAMSRVLLFVAALAAILEIGLLLIGV